MIKMLVAFIAVFSFSVSAQAASAVAPYAWYVYDVGSTESPWEYTYNKDITTGDHGGYVAVEVLIYGGYSYTTALFLNGIKQTPFNTIPIDSDGDSIYDIWIQQYEFYNMYSGTLTVKDSESSWNITRDYLYVK